MTRAQQVHAGERRAHLIAPPGDRRRQRKKIRSMKITSMSLVAGLVAASGLLSGCVSDEEVVLDEPADPTDTADTAETADEPGDRGPLFANCTLQAWRSNTWQNVRPTTTAPIRARVISTNTGGSWNVNSSRNIIWNASTNKMDCGETWSSPAAPKSCDMVASTDTEATTYHCDSPGPGVNINDCIYSTAGTTMYVDSGLTICIGYDSNGYLRSYPDSPASNCKLFRCI